MAIIPTDFVVRGLIGARPAAGIAGRVYVVTDATVRRVTYDDGAVWQDVYVDNPYAPGGASLAAPAVLLDYVANTDLANPINTAASTWTDVLANQNFTKVKAGTIIRVAVRGAALAANNGASSSWGVRFIIDSAGAPVTRILGGENSGGSFDYINPFAGVNVVAVAGLSAAVHTIKVQLICSAASGLFFLRASTIPNTESLGIQVVEEAG